MASLRVVPLRSFSAVSAIYTELLRNTPLTLVFFFCVFVLPKLGIVLDFQISAIIALTSIRLHSLQKHCGQGSTVCLSVRPRRLAVLV